jgi:hypothetical protein
MSDIATVFGRPLQQDPAVAIAIPALHATEPSGPEHRVQFVVELVGPRSIPAASAAQLLSPHWFDSLGKPEIFAMGPSDRAWQTLNPGASGSYDSLALAWDMVSTNGQLTSASANHLFKVAESFGSQIQRRAMPLPPPADIDRTVATLVDIKEGLDIGVEVLIVPQVHEFLERDVWIALSELGFDLAPSGFFELRTPDGITVLTVTPTGGRVSFTLGQVQQGVRHPGLLIGFNVPTSPAPEFALSALFSTADHICRALQGFAMTDEDQPLNASKSQLQSYLGDGIGALKRVGIIPGSRAALKLFG